MPRFAEAFLFNQVYNNQIYIGLGPTLFNFLSDINDHMGLMRAKNC